MYTITIHFKLMSRVGELQLRSDMFRYGKTRERDVAPWWERSLMVRRVVGLLLHDGPIELFLVTASAARLIEQRSWYVLSCLWDDAYKRTLTARLKSYFCMRHSGCAQFYTNFSKSPSVGKISACPPPIYLSVKIRFRFKITVLIRIRDRCKVKGQG